MRGKIVGDEVNRMYPKLFLDYFRRFDRTPEVFVAMSISPETDPRWGSIFAPAIESVGLVPYRVDNRKVSDSILTDILSGIGRAKFILVDLSFAQSQPPAPNANVMYELGIAHAMRLPEEVIVVRGDHEPETPFDIRHIRWTRFDPADVSRSRRMIEGLVRAAGSELDLTRDLIVRRTLDTLDLDAIWFLDTVRGMSEFDLYPFDPDRKGLYGLGYRDSSEAELRDIARRLTEKGILRPLNPGHPSTWVYGATPEYAITLLGQAIISTIVPLQRQAPVRPAKQKDGLRKSIRTTIPTQKAKGQTTRKRARRQDPD